MAPWKVRVSLTNFAWGPQAWSDSSEWMQGLEWPVPQEECSGDQIEENGGQSSWGCRADGQPLSPRTLMLPMLSALLTLTYTDRRGCDHDVLPGQNFVSVSG